MLAIPCVCAAQGATFFVSPTGSDLNNGTSYSTPFETFRAAQSAMEATGGGTTYIEGGKYNLQQPISLGNADPHQAWIAYPGETPILDGSVHKVPYAFFVDEFNADVTIAGLDIRHFTNSGIYALYTSNLTVSGNFINNITSPDWRTGASGASILFENVQNSTITKNHVNTNTYAGIAVQAGGWGDSISGDIVSDNVVKNACTAVNDCGGIYVLDVPQASLSVQVVGNYIQSFGTTTSLAKGIYLDNGTSDILVTNNTVTGNGTYCWELHGGFGNILQHNICDMSSLVKAGLYQNYAAAPNGGMAGNVFEQNIVYSSATSPDSVWDYVNETGGGFALPADSGNLYYGTQQRIPNTDPIIDQNPSFANPMFVNPAASNYRFQRGSPALRMGFPANQ